MTNCDRLTVTCLCDRIPENKYKDEIYRTYHLLFRYFGDEISNLLRNRV
ncbi:hypothetical protein APA_3678 [Pseudanabaena sp. lw0831]|nr:hypothetical protein APA_3678 [Pseudanabaena sp. lw0831]